MPADRHRVPQEQAQAFEQALEEVVRLRRFEGAPAEFWPAFLAAAAGLLGAVKGALALRDPNRPETWKRLGDWSGNGHADRSIMLFNRQLTELAVRAAEDGNHLRAVENAGGDIPQAYALGVRLPLNRPEETCVAAFLIPEVARAQAEESLRRLQLVADTPSSYLMTQAANQARADVEKFATSLDVLVEVNAEKRFLAAALAFCNGLANRFGCDRVSLGWLEKGYIRLKSMSRTERFEKNMVAVKSLEMVMEECYDQDDEVVWPTLDGATVVTRDHELFAKEQSSGHLCSLPMRLEGNVEAVLTCERQSRPFTPQEVQQFRLACDQVMRRLADLKRRDRWFGARLATATREKLAVVLGPEQTWTKVLAILIAVALAVLFLIPFDYRVEGNFILRSDEVSHLNAPFDAYINEVHVRPGDQVESNMVLLSLNTEELRLQEASAIAEQSRYIRESDKARATNALAEMRIAGALAEQADARLDLVRYQIDRAAIRAPFDGVVVEGDLRERIGAPVKQGDPLFKVARTDNLYVEAEINQRDIHEILDATRGEIAFVTQPEKKFPVQIERIEPAAFPKEGENIFMVRCSLEDQLRPWWRPGMSGLCKIEAGRRSLFWIFTHRTVDFLRMFFWW